MLGDRATGPALVPVLQQTGAIDLLYAVGLAAGLVIGVVRATV